jgi:hypothetical protein
MIWMSLVGCAQEISVSDNELAVDSSPTLAITTIMPSQPIVTPSSTDTPASVLTQDIPPTEIASQSEIILPTSTSKPIATPISLSLPNWITEASANILLLGTTPARTIGIFNVDNQQRYDIPMRLSVFSPKWQWQEDGYWLIYQEPNQAVKGIDIKTGNVARMSDTYRDVISPDGRYAARSITHGDREGLVTIVDRETGTESELVNPFLHLQSRDEAFIESAWAVYWSPDGTYLSVLYDKLYWS